MAFDAFVSYSHAADGRLAPALKKGLERMGRGRSQLRALHVFHDTSNLAINPHLWGSVVEAMDASEWFVLLVSPDAAASTWVEREIEYWCAHNDAERVLLVLTAGTLTWDNVSGDFDPQTSDALPPSLAGRFAEEPLYLDFRWARGDEQLDLRNPRFRAGVAGLAAPMHGLTKDEMESEDVRRHKRTVRIRFAVGALIAVLVLVAAAAITVALTTTTENASKQVFTKFAKRVEDSSMKRVRVTYKSADSAKTFIRAQDGRGKVVYIVDDGNGLLLLDGGKATNCVDVTNTRRCFSGSATPGSSDHLALDAIATNLLFVSAFDAVAAARNTGFFREIGAESIAGRPATCAILTPDSVNGDLKLCADDETGVVLRWGLQGSPADTTEATVVDQPQESDFALPTPNT